MKKINIEFKKEEREDIGIIISASEKSEEVLALMRRLDRPFIDALIVYDDRGGTVILPLDKIVSISSDRRKLKVVAEEGEYELRSSLRDVESELDSPDFIRISRYEIINLHMVKRFDFSVSGSLKITMKNGMETWASRRFISEIKKRLMRKDVKDAE